MKPKTNPSVDTTSQSLRLSSQDESFIRLAAAILGQPEEKICESLAKMREKKAVKRAA